MVSFLLLLFVLHANVVGTYQLMLDTLHVMNFHALSIRLWYWLLY